MQFRDLSAQYKALKSEIDAGIQSVIENNNFILGAHVEELEDRLAEFAGVKNCISCANGTDALILVLMAWGIGEGDAVFVPDFTFFATASCALVRGATPVLVDIDPRTFNMCPSSLENAIKNTLADGRLIPKVIIPVDLFGQPADYNLIGKIAKQYGLRILEDGAQGFGGSVGGKGACSFGDAAATSFFPAKPLGCYGDGGAIFTNDDALDELLRSLRAHGRSPEDKYDNRIIGLNSRLDTIQAAILLPKLKAFKEYELDAVNSAADKYTKALKDVVVTPHLPEGCRSGWAQYTILLENEQQRDGLQEHLKKAGIPAMIYYPRGIHMQTAMQFAGYSPDCFPVTEKICRTCLSLPIHPYMATEDINKICDEIYSFKGYNQLT